MIQPSPTAVPRLRGKVLIGLLWALTLGGFETIAALFSTVDIPTRTVTIPYRAVYLLLALIVFVWYGMLRKQVVSSSIWYVISTLWLLLIVRLIVDLSVFHVFTQIPSGDYWLMVPGNVFLPLLAFGVVPDNTTLALVKRMALVALSGAAFAVSYVGWTQSGSVIAAIGRLGTAILNPITIGQLGVSLSILVTLELLTRRLNGWKKILYAVLLALGGFLILASGARGPQLALVVCLLVSLGVQFRKLNGMIAILGLALLIWLTPLMVRYIESGSEIRVFQRWDEFENTEGSRSAGERLILFANAWQQFLSNPITGNSMVEAQSGSYPHNLVLEAFMATGFLGGGLILLFIGLCLSSCFRLLHRSTPHTWIAMLFLQHLIVGLFSGSLYLSGPFWCWSVAVISVEKGTRKALALRADLRPRGGVSHAFSRQEMRPLTSSVKTQQVAL